MRQGGLSASTSRSAPAGSGGRAVGGRGRWVSPAGRALLPQQANRCCAIVRGAVVEVQTGLAQAVERGRRLQAAAAGPPARASQTGPPACRLVGGQSDRRSDSLRGPAGAPPGPAPCSALRAVAWAAFRRLRAPAAVHWAIGSRTVSCGQAGWGCQCEGSAARVAAARSPPACDARCRCARSGHCGAARASRRPRFTLCAWRQRGRAVLSPGGPQTQIVQGAACKPIHDAGGLRTPRG